MEYFDDSCIYYNCISTTQSEALNEITFEYFAYLAM